MPSSTDLILEIVNGSGIGEVYSNNLFDKDKYKNIMGRVSQEVSENVRLGAIGYYGNELINGFYLGKRNEIKMLGADATLMNENFELNLQYLYRNDTNPFAYLMDNKIKTRGGFAELIFRPEGDESNWYLLGLYNQISSDESVLDYKSVTGHAGYLLRRNIRLVSEVTYDITNEYAKFSVGLVTAF